MPTKIEWTDETWNPIRGTKGKWHCTKVSEGCRNCYAERLNRRFGGPAYVVGADTLRLDPDVLGKPIRWRRARMVFVCSMTDLFHEDVPFEWIDRMFAIMIATPRHTFQVLTKRIARAAEYFGHSRALFSAASAPWPAPNVWLGTSVEDQATADKRIPELLKTPAAVRFLSCEPLLGPIELPLAEPTGKFRTHRGGRRQLQMKQTGVHWVICGGESGPHARPMHPEWARSIRDQCQAAGVSFFMKQMAKKAPIPEDLLVREYPHACQIS